MRIDIVFPVLPPTLDGIGDHTARLAEALSKLADVRVLTAQEEYDSISGVEIERAFSLASRSGFRELVSAVRKQPPDWLLLQFNQFSYGRWGLNPFVPWVLYMIRKMVRETRIAVLFHEDFVPVTNWKNGLMTMWQRAQFFAIGRQADHIFFSIDPWVKKYRSWFPDQPVDHVPVGSNIPYIETDRRVVRRDLGIGDQTFVMGVFGSMHASKLIGHIKEAAKAVKKVAEDSLLLYIGPDGDKFKTVIKDHSVCDAGSLPPEEVSRHFSAMDVHLAPFMDGVSTRRGSFMVGLQHGIPSVTTSGPLTDQTIKETQGSPFLMSSVECCHEYALNTLALLSNSRRRKQMSQYARNYYNKRFAFDVIAKTLVNHLEEEVPA